MHESPTTALPEAPAIPADAVTFETVAIDAIAESPNNPRKHFQPAALEQLQASLARSGMITPIRVRLLPAPAAGDARIGPPYMIAAGHRRYRAARALGWTFVPVLASPMTDAQFFELLTVENLQRDDLHPLEEARSFELMMLELGYDVSGIAHRVGKSIDYVYDRLRLLKLSPVAAELFAANRFPLGYAIILSRLGHADQALVIGTPKKHYDDGGLFRNDHAADQEELTGKPTPEQILDRLALHSLRHVQAWVNDRIRFDRDAEDNSALFPETVKAIEAAKAEDLKVVPITFEHAIHPTARADERTLGPRSFKSIGVLAECDYAMLGVVVAGERRADAVPVCAAKDKCQVHWAKEIRAKRRDEREREAAEATGKQADLRKKEQTRAAADEREQLKRRELEARIKKSTPALVEAARVALEKLTVGDLAPQLLEACGWHSQKATVKQELAALGKKPEAEDVLRAAALLLVTRYLDNSWNWNMAVRDLKAIGVNPHAVMREAAPITPAAPKKPEAKRRAKGEAPESKKPLAGDVRRKKAAKKAGAAR